MEAATSLNKRICNDPYLLVRRQLAIISFVILCIRGFWGWLGYDTLLFTLLLNLLIVASINYNHVNKLFLIVPFLCVSMIYNKTVLGIIDLIAMCLILRYIKISKLANIYLVTLLIFIPIWIFLLRNGYLESKRWFDPAKGGEFWDYGFANPNGLGIFGFHICATLYLLLYRKLIILSLVATLIISQFFYSISFCRTAWLGGMVLALCSLMTYLKLFRKWMKLPIALLPPFIFIIIIFLAKKIGSYEFLEIFFSGRFAILY